MAEPLIVAKTTEPAVLELLLKLSDVAEGATNTHIVKAAYLLIQHIMLSDCKDLEQYMWNVASIHETLQTNGLSHFKQRN